MGGRIAFTAKVAAVGPGSAWYHAEFPKKVSALLGTKAAVKVRGTINGHAFRSSAFPTGEGTHGMMVNAAMRKATGLKEGATARFELEVDTKLRTVRVPARFKEALAKRPAAKANFAKLPPSHKKAYVDYITEAKRPETRQRRVLQAVEKLGQGRGAWE